MIRRFSVFSSTVNFYFSKKTYCDLSLERFDEAVVMRDCNIGSFPDKKV